MRNKRNLILGLISLVVLVALGCRALQAPVESTSPTSAADITTQAADPEIQALPTFEGNDEISSPTEGVSSGTETDGQADMLLDAYRSTLSRMEDIPAYSIDVDIDYLSRSLTGHAQIDYTNLEDRPLEQVYFRLLPNGHKSYGNGSLTVSNLSVDGQAVEYNLSLSDTVLEIPLASPLEIGESLRFNMQFEAQVPEDFGGGDSPSGYGIYNFTDSVLALSGWYPILAVYDENGWNLDPVSAIGDSVYSDMAFYTVTLSMDPGPVMASTGVVVDRSSKAGKVEFRLLSGPVRDFFIILSPAYQVTSRQVDGVLVNSYYLPGHADAGQAALDISAESLRIFNRRFGAYPYRELDVVDGPMRNALGVEYPAIIMIASQLYEDPSDPSFIVATAHEVAHQWWYNVVGNDVFEEPWLDEGLTTYSSSLYYQEALGPGWYDGYVEYWESRYEQLLDEGTDDLVTGGLEYYEDPERRSSYGGVVYNKAALFFKALRDEIGDQAFFAGLSAYYRDHQFGIARGKDLLEAFEEASGRNLDALYDRWLYSADGS